MRLAYALLASLLPISLQAAQCSAKSPEGTVALIELYTSEGCSSCPPADRWLSGLGAKGYVPARVVPLSLHVDYWDYIGWKDRFAKSEFSRRQREMAALQRADFVYTPQVMLQGKDFRAWGSSQAFDRAVARINEQPARARLRLRLDVPRRGAMTAIAEAQLLDKSQVGDAVLYLAVYENKLASQVSAGENRGARLDHDHVVLQWSGPFGLPASGAPLVEQRALPLPRKAIPANSGVAAFVQNRRSGEVLQALMLPVCRG